MEGGELILQWRFEFLSFLVGWFNRLIFTDTHWYTTSPFPFISSPLLPLLWAYPPQTSKNCKTWTGSASLKTSCFKQGKRILGKAKLRALLDRAPPRLKLQERKWLKSSQDSPHSRSDRFRGRNAWLGQQKEILLPPTPLPLRSRGLGIPCDSLVCGFLCYGGLC